LWGAEGGCFAVCKMINCRYTTFFVEFAHVKME